MKEIEGKLYDLHEYYRKSGKADQEKESEIEQEESKKNEQEAPLEVEPERLKKIEDR